jgi:hypothetical protein
MPPSDDITLRDYFEQRINDLERRIMERFQQNDTAISKAERAMNTRLDAMNEFREALRDSTGRMITRPEHDTLEARLRIQEQFRANLDGRILTISALVGGGISIVVGVVVGVLLKIFNL